MGDNIHNQIQEMRRQLGADFVKYGKNIARHMAQEIADHLYATAGSAIINFYTSYDPKYYMRHENFFNTYKRYYKNHGNRFTGGVDIIDNLPDVYSSPTNTVFDRVWQGGFHGLSSLYYHNPAPMYPSPMMITEKKRDQILQHISQYESRAAQKAKSDKYNFLFK